MNGSIGYTYDAVGNRVSRTSTVAPVPAANYPYDANDRLTTDSYDANGSTIGSGGNTYTYDFENHLLTQSGSAPVSIVYDGDGNRVAETASGVITGYLVDDRNPTGYAQVVEEISNSSVQRVYTYGLSRISENQTSGVSFYGYDGQGSVRLLLDTGGAITDQYTFDAFGSLVSRTGSTPNAYLYSGEQSDPNLSFYYLRARYMEPKTGRFWTADSYDGDPFDPRSLHRYSYAAQNPITNRDPSGRQLTTIELLAISAIVGYSVYLGVQALTPDLEKARSVGLMAALATGLFFAPQVAVPAAGLLRLGNIFVDQDAVTHIDEFHTVFGRFAEVVDKQEIGPLFEKSVFMPGENLLALVDYANTATPYASRGALAYTVYLTRVVGYDVVTRAPIYYYTVIVDAVSRVVLTAYPGGPRGLVP
ncbi:MAG: RHS repeat-associated core domain-containing protein [Chloroflexi bacterium]|nr:RHS repeat-associated core domain-containing protein [Chloroflexota bacterium]